MIIAESGRHIKGQCFYFLFFSAAPWIRGSETQRQPGIQQKRLTKWENIPYSNNIYSVYKIIDSFL
jgi:hypothetical protein